MNTAAKLKKVLFPEDGYSFKYLNEYWPEDPQSAVGWADNTLLMISYQEAALAIKSHFNGKAKRALDISTGPALAPLLATMSCISEVQLSDFHLENREMLRKIPIEYWRNYVPMLVRSHNKPEENIDKILRELDVLRLQHTPVEIDLFNVQTFLKCINPRDYDIVSMHFVADAITSNLGDYLRCLGTVTDMVKQNAAFIMSATVDSRGWSMGDVDHASPNVDEKTITDFLLSQGFKIKYLSRSIRHPKLTYSGGWIVVSAVKK